MKYLSTSDVEKLLRRARQSNRIKFPSHIHIGYDNGKYYLSISPDKVIKNMQDDSAAFEGWAIVLYRWLRPKEIIIDWDVVSNNINNGHYQRFLFRVIEFCKSYSWCKISIKSEALISESKIVVNKTYNVNKPGSDRSITRPSPNSHEAILEMLLYNHPEALMQYTSAKSIDRQLPVGISEFTGKKSAVDLWGRDNDNNLLLFELKTERNYKVGIISELFFYSSFSAYVRDGIFKSEVIAPFEGVIKSYFIALKLHPLIDDEVLEILNRNNNKIYYDAIVGDNFNTVTYANKNP